MASSRSVHDAYTIAIPAGTELYRGHLERNEDLSQRTEAWFTDNINDAKIYGYVTKYFVRDNVYLINMNDVEMHTLLSRLFAKYAELYKPRIHPTAFRTMFVRRGGKIGRRSEFAADAQVVEMVRYYFPDMNGFIWNPENTEESKFHHNEILLFHPAKHLSAGEPVTDINYDDLGIQTKRIERRDKEKRKEARKPRSRSGLALVSRTLKFD